MPQLSATQMRCLSDLPLANVYHCLKTFAGWIETAVYDFAALPFTYKANLCPHDLLVLKEIPRTWEGMQLYTCTFPLALY